MNRKRQSRTPPTLDQVIRLAEERASKTYRRENLYRALAIFLRAKKAESRA